MSSAAAIAPELQTGGNGRRWTIDPIDGTRDFVRGNPSWSILIALEEAGEVVAGISYLPALDEMFTLGAEGIYLGAPPPSTDSAQQQQRWRTMADIQTKIFQITQDVTTSSPKSADPNFKQFSGFIKG